jgi:perosamine synthetase
VIRLTIPSIEEDDLQAVRDVLLSGHLVNGVKTVDFERAVAEHLGAQYAVAVSSGTAALHLALLALDVKPGDMVVVPTFSFVATANVVEMCGARPVFVDILPDTFNLDPNRLEEVLKQLYARSATAALVKAIMPVHAFGQMADMPAVEALAQQYGIPIIEDAACALGATLHGRPAGTWSAAGCFSFHPRKAITTGEGGMIVTNDGGLASRMKALRNHGQDPESPFPDFILPGLNYRITEFQAALGLTQFTKLERILAARRRLASSYDTLLANTTLLPPANAAGSEPVYQSYVALLPREVASQRPALMAGLRAKGIETTIGTWHMPMTTYFRTRYGHSAGEFPVTDDVFARALTLPIYERLEAADQERVVAELVAELALQQRVERVG